MQYKVTENGKDAVKPAPGLFKRCIFDTPKEAILYSNLWLGSAFANMDLTYQELRHGISILDENNSICIIKIEEI